MPKNRKLFLNNTCVFVTTRVISGLPFVAKHYMELILWGILARAQKHCPIKVCHFICMGNHFHFLLVVEDPEQISAFIDRVKTESAHAVNRLLGRRKTPLWEDGFDSPTILDFETAIRYIVYIYANPARANLIQSIKQYPGVSSWQMYQSKSCHRSSAWIKRNHIHKIPRRDLSGIEEKLFCNQLHRHVRAYHNFTLSPDAWMECFPETRTMTPDETNELVLSALNDAEQRITTERKVPILGVNRLTTQSIYKPFTPKKYSKRMVCLSKSIDLRANFISRYRGLCAQAKKVYQRWKLFDFSIAFPSGLFLPSLPRASNICPTYGSI